VPDVRAATAGVLAPRLNHLLLWRRLAGRVGAQVTAAPCPCAACAARREQARLASAAGVAARRQAATEQARDLEAVLAPVLRRDRRLSASAVARRLVACGAIEPDLEDRARRIAGRLRRRVALATTAGCR
jgi:hypothetical protein